MAAQGFLMQDFAAGASAIQTTQSNAIDLQTKQATQQDVIQESHDKAQKSALDLQATAMKVSNERAYQADISKLAASAGFSEMTPEQKAAAVSDIAMKHGADPKVIADLYKSGAEAEHYKKASDKLDLENTQTRLDQFLAHTDTWKSPADALKDLEEMKKRGVAKGLQSAELDQFIEKAKQPDADLTQLKKDLGDTFTSHKEKLEAAKLAELKRQDDIRQQRADADSARANTQADRLSAMLGRMASGDGDKKEKRIDDATNKATIRLQGIMNPREKEAERLQGKLEDAREKASSNFFGVDRTDEEVENQNAVKAAKKRVDNFKKETDARLRAEILSTRGEVQDNLKSAHPDLFPTKSASKPEAKPTGDIPKDIPAGSTLAGKTPDGRDVYKSPDGKNHVSSLAAEAPKTTTTPTKPADKKGTLNVK